MLAALNTAIPNHRQMWLDGGAGSLGYAQAGEFRDVLLVPPLSNITVTISIFRTANCKLKRSFFR